MLAMLPGNGWPAHVLVFGVETWLYVVQHISPMTQLAPCRLVSGVAVLGRLMQVEYVAARVVWLGIVYMSVRALKLPEPRSFSLKNAVWLVPSVIDWYEFWLR